LVARFTTSLLGEAVTPLARPAIVAPLEIPARSALSRPNGIIFIINKHLLQQKIVNVWLWVRTQRVINGDPSSKRRDRFWKGFV
jgi:hypothetical protein